MCGHTRFDKIKNGHTRQKVQIACNEDKREKVARDAVMRRPIDTPVRRCATMMSEDVKTGRGRPNITRKEVVAKDQQFLVINGDLAKGRVQLKKKIHIDDIY